MNRKIILLLLLGHSLLAHAKLNEPLSLKFDSELGATETTPAITVYQNNEYENINRVTLSSHPARSSLRLKLSSEGIDESRIGKISEHERIALLKKQKQIYSDKKSASFINSEKKLASSTTENGINRLQHFAWHSESIPFNSRIVEVSQTKATAKNPNQIEQIESYQTELTWQLGGTVTLGLVLYYFARKIRLRFFFQAKPHAQIALGLNTHQNQLSACPLLQVDESLVLSSTTIDRSRELELPFENDVSLNTQPSYLSVEVALPEDESWATSTSMVISPVAKQPLELPSYPATNLIEMAPVVRPMISTIRNLVPQPLISPQSKTVEEVERPEPVNFLEDFNPSKYDNATEFLESRRALTIEQIIEWSKCVTGGQQAFPVFHKFG